MYLVHSVYLQQDDFNTQNIQYFCRFVYGIKARIQILSSHLYFRHLRTLSLIKSFESDFAVISASNWGKTCFS